MFINQETPEEDRQMHQPKRCKYNNKDEDNSSNYYQAFFFIFLFSIFKTLKFNWRFIFYRKLVNNDITRIEANSVLKRLPNLQIL